MACLLSLLVACSPQKNTVQPTIISALKQGRSMDQAGLYALDHWSIVGKISLQYQGRTHIGSLEWVQKGEEYKIILYGPAGFGGIRIEGSPGWVRVKSDQGSQEATSPEALVYSLYGFDLPVSSLAFWVKALPMPFEPFELEDDQGLPSTLSQSGWKMAYSDYVLQESFILPTKIKAQNERMKMVIKVQRWGFLLKSHHSSITSSVSPDY